MHSIQMWTYVIQGSKTRSGCCDSGLPVSIFDLAQLDFLLPLRRPGSFWSFVVLFAECHWWTWRMGCCESSLPAVDFLQYLGTVKPVEAHSLVLLIKNSSRAALWFIDVPIFLQYSSCEAWIFAAASVFRANRLLRFCSQLS